MELQIKAYKAQPIEWNYEELKTQLLAKLQDYKTLQYTPEQIQAAKTDRANLNSLKKALSDERIRRQKEYMEPFDKFANQVRELCDLIDEPVNLIDRQIKEVEEREKQDKRNSCIEIFNNTEHPEWLKYEQIESTRWYNKTTSLKSVEADIKGIIETINKDLTLLSEMPEFSFEAIEEYKRTLDASRALSEGKRLADIQKRKEAEAKAKAEAESKAEEIPFAPVPEEMTEIKAEKVDPERFWVRFEAYISREEALELKAFFHMNNITYQPIKEG